MKSVSVLYLAEEGGDRLLVKLSLKLAYQDTALSSRPLKHRSRFPCHSACLCNPKAAELKKPGFPTYPINSRHRASSRTQSTLSPSA